MTLCIMKLCIMALCIMTLSQMTHSITTFSIMALGIIALFNKRHSICVLIIPVKYDLRSIRLYPVLLCVVMMSATKLSVRVPS